MRPRFPVLPGGLAAAGHAASHQLDDVLTLRGGTLAGQASLLAGHALSTIMCDLFSLCVVGGFLSRMRKQRDARRRIEWLRSTARGGGRLPPSVSVLLPCYLPNERPIMLDTIEHLMTAVEYPGPFELVVCYNAPSPMPLRRSSPPGASSDARHGQRGARHG